MPGTCLDVFLLVKERAVPRRAQGSEGEAPASTTVSSRFAYEVLTKEDQAAKAPGVRRGKDGHVSLPGLDDPFAAPAAGRAPRCGARVFHNHEQSDACLLPRSV